MVRVDGERIKVIPSSGAYLPVVDDVIIGVVVGVQRDRLLLDINSMGFCTMTIGREDIRWIKKGYSGDEGKTCRFYNVGDIISIKVAHVNEVNECRLIKPHKLAFIPYREIICIHCCEYDRIAALLYNLTYIALSVNININKNDFAFIEKTCLVQ